MAWPELLFLALIAVVTAATVTVILGGQAAAGCAGTCYLAAWVVVLVGRRQR
jgi:hypothetical protein